MRVYVVLRPSQSSEPNGYSLLRHICSGVLLNHDPEGTWIFVMNGYSVYLDDSGHPIDKPYMVIGGFIAREDRWIAFENQWKQILRLRDIALPFHATDFFRERRNDPKLKHIIDDLVRVITNHVEAAFSVCIDIEAYKRLNREACLQEIAGTPFALMTRCLYKTVDDWQAIVGPRQPLLYFVEHGTLHNGDMLDCLTDRDNLIPPISVPKDHVAAQAADLYAYGVYQFALGNNDLFDAFGWKLLPHKERLDARIFAPELEAYLASPTAVIHTPARPEGVRMPIPKRSEIGEYKFNFIGNKKKLRRPSLGIKKGTT